MLTDRQVIAKQFAEVNEANRKNLGDKFAPLELPEEEISVVSVRDLVTAVVRHYSFPADVVWRYTLPDLLLMLKAREEVEDSTDVREAEVNKLVAGLSVGERLELERWVSEHT